MGETNVVAKRQTEDEAVSIDGHDHRSMDLVRKERKREEEREQAEEKVKG